jgi:hypothetical protein
MANSLRKERSNLADQDYKIKAEYFYSKLRASWERALEEIGLAHTVMRHRDYINPKNIKKISALDLNDCDNWLNHYGKCCTYTESHDGSRGRNKTMPEPDQLLLDVKSLKDWSDTIKDKHNKIPNN